MERVVPKPIDLCSVSEINNEIDFILWAHSGRLISWDDRDIALYVLLKAVWKTDRDIGVASGAYLFTSINTKSEWDFPSGVQERWPYRSVSLNPNIDSVALSDFTPERDPALLAKMDEILLSGISRGRVGGSSEMDPKLVSEWVLAVIFDEDLLGRPLSERQKLDCFRWVLLDAKLPLSVQNPGLNCVIPVSDNPALMSFFQPIRAQLRARRSGPIYAHYTQLAHDALQYLDAIRSQESPDRKRILNLMSRAFPGREVSDDVVNSVAFIAIALEVLGIEELFRNLQSGQSDQTP